MFRSGCKLAVMRPICLDYTCLRPLSPPERSVMKRVFALTMALVVLNLGQFMAVAADDDKDDKPEASKVDVKAEKVLEGLATYFQGVKSFEVRMTSTVKIEAALGSSEEAAEYDIIAQRPNLLAVKLKKGEMGATVVCDGKELITYVPSFKKYTVDEAPKTLEDLLASPEGRMAHLGNSPAFGALALAFHDPKKVMETIESAKYLGEEKIDDVECHHLKLAEGQIDLEVWIEKGSQPRVRKAVPDLERALRNGAARIPEGFKLSMWATFDKWEIDVKPDADAFAYSPPASADKVKELFGMPSQEMERHPLLGENAPDFKLETLTGKDVKLADLKEKKVIVLDFWATWCGPCVKALPTISEVAGKFKDKGVVFYAVNQAEDAETVRAFLKDQDLDVPVLLDTEGAVGDKYGARAIPQTVLIGKDGRVQVVHVGLSPNLEEELTQQLTDLVAGKNLADAQLAAEKEAAEDKGKKKSDDDEK